MGNAKENNVLQAGSAPLSLRGIWCAGLFLLLSFSTVSSLAGEGVMLVEGAIPGYGSLTRAASFLVLALMARRFVSLLSRCGLLCGCALVLGLCSLVLGYCFNASASLIAVATVVLLVQNALFACLYLAWMEFYAQLDLQHGLVSLCLVHLLSALLSFGLFLLSPTQLVPLLAAFLPALSFVMLRKADRITADAPYRQGEAQKFSWSISPRPLILLVVFTATNGFLRSALVIEDRAFVLLGVCVAALVVLVIARFSFDRLEIKWLYEIAVPVLVAGSMVVMTHVPGGAIAAAFFSNAAFTLFAIFITVIFCAISFRYGVNAVWLLGITQAAMTFGSFAGPALGRLEETLLAGGAFAEQATLAVLVVALVAFSMLLVSDRDFDTTWGVVARRESEESASIVEEEELLQRRCAKVAKRYGLTRREEEILQLIMRGYTLTRIGEELYVAESTMKTHSRHIYRKVGVANRQELQKFVETYPR